MFYTTDCQVSSWPPRRCRATWRLVPKRWSSPLLLKMTPTPSSWVWTRAPMIHPWSASLAPPALPMAWHRQSAFCRRSGASSEDWWPLAMPWQHPSQPSMAPPRRTGVVVVPDLETSFLRALALLRLLPRWSQRWKASLPAWPCESRPLMSLWWISPLSSRRKPRMKKFALRWRNDPRATWRASLATLMRHLCRRTSRPAPSLAPLMPRLASCWTLLLSRWCAGTTMSGATRSFSALD